MTKPTMWPVRPAKTQLSLGIRPVWWEFSLCAQWVVKNSIFLHTNSEDSDPTERMPKLMSLRWVQMSFCWFCHEAAQFCFKQVFAELPSSFPASCGGLDEFHDMGPHILRGPTCPVFLRVYLLYTMSSLSHGEHLCVYDVFRMAGISSG